MVRMMLTRCWETTPFPRDRVDGCEAMLEISERMVHATLPNTPDQAFSELFRMVGSSKEITNHF